ncbi:hypothetical protein LCGC14_2559490 [marine sediment metagenome]|uniref:Uncharacterized protein n=1 Tax=marine sediment metagenome TaxID=412755 RepID=A0A0F9B8C5_9ZZZZ
MIYWNKLIGTPWKTSEDFCYVLTQKGNGDLGVFTNIDDSAGGDSVEF